MENRQHRSPLTNPPLTRLTETLLWYTQHTPEAAHCVPPYAGLEPVPLNIRSLSASLARRAVSRPGRGLLLVVFSAAVMLGFSGCTTPYYKFPQYNFAGRPIPPSKLANRVMVSYTNGSQGALGILDALRDIRNNVENTVSSFAISGYSGNNPITILNFPDELRGFVYSNAGSYTITPINYATEAAASGTQTINSPVNSFALAPDFIRTYVADEEVGELVVSDNSTGGTYDLNLPNVYQVAVNAGDTVALAMVRNSNTLYRVLKLNPNAISPPGAVDCQPEILPVYCVVPVPGSFDRPVGAVFSNDGTSVYVLNCGVECGGGQNGGAGVSFLPESALYINNIPTSAPYPVIATHTISIPGGATAALTDGVNLYFAGQQLQPDGLFAGFLTVMPLNTLVPGAPISIADGNHSKLLLADDNTLWIAAQNCSVGERAKQGLNYNCLTAYNTSTATAAIVPALTAASPTVPYPNQNENQVYYGSATGLCWVQSLHKVYTAYGGQVHAFKTSDLSEIDNQYITVPGTALDVAYIDATNDTAD